MEIVPNKALSLSLSLSNVSGAALGEGAVHTELEVARMLEHLLVVSPAHTYERER